MKVTLNCLLVAAVIVLIYMCYRSVRGPIEFREEKDSREKAIISRLIDIRKAQIEYKNKYKVHAANFDQLEKFLKEDKIPFIRKEGVLTDAQLESGLTEKKALKLGLIKRDTIWVIAKDTLFGKNFNVDSLRFVPGTSRQFFMDTAFLNSGSGYKINVFEASVMYDVYLNDLNKRELANLKDLANKSNKFPGLRVGSLVKINNNAGNWE